MTATTMTATSPLASSHPTRLRRGLITTVFALAATLTSVLLPSSASAGSPGAFNVATCNPNNRTITQEVEVYRSYTNEYIKVRGFVRNNTTGGTATGSWYDGYGHTARASFVWTNMARGNYTVYYQWASWNASRGQYNYSGWYQVTNVSTLGWWDPYYGSNGAYRGGANGRCSI